MSHLSKKTQANHLKHFIYTLNEKNISTRNYTQKDTTFSETITAGGRIATWSPALVG